MNRNLIVVVPFTVFVLVLVIGKIARKIYLSWLQIFILIIMALIGIFIAKITKYGG